MESYLRLYRITVRHDYFGESPCPLLRLRPSSEGETLMRRRGMMFREEAAGTWSLFFTEEPDTEKDVMLLDLSIADPMFVLYTDWSGFRPTDSYDLRLPASEGQLDATAAIAHTDRKRSIGSGFCTVALRLTEELVQAARSGKPEEVVLQFHAPKKRWEYLFFPQTEESIDGKQLLLEDMTGSVAFSPFTRCKAYGREAWRTVSENPVAMRTTYRCRLRLTALRGNGKQKHVLLSHVEPPQPGRYTSKDKEMLRQVCYF